MSAMTIGIVGLGLIGGSLAKSIKRFTLHTVYGADTDRETMALAILSGAADAELTGENIGLCDLILVAICPAAAINWVKENAKRIPQSALLVDMCGIKRPVCAALAPIAEANGFLYIGGHPMAGKERGGFVNSSHELFQGASMILTPDGRTDMHMLDLLKAFFLDIGFGRLTFSTPEEHDRIIAYTSQLAHIVSSAYIKSPESERRRGFSAGSFRDMTRVARLDEAMWSELCMSNTDFLTEQLDILIDNLLSYREALASGDMAGLKELFREGREKKAAVGGS